VNSTELQYFKEYLLKQKGSILNKSNEFKTEAKIIAASSSDEVEVVSNELSLNLAIHLHERDRTVLYQIERALAKLEDGEYGICEGCGADIQVMRLKARPFTNLCIDCAEELEDRRHTLN
jgi:DnaK suppressor protein